jgi:hypothetical protein
MEHKCASCLQRGDIDNCCTVRQHESDIYELMFENAQKLNKHVLCTIFLMKKRIYIIFTIKISRICKKLES